jgi:diguanylate cyclase (GGDEF)-like protein/PAS domain S-box-containing protein
MSDVVLLVNEGTVEWISPSVTAVAGWLPDEVVGTGPADLVHPDDLDRLLAAWLPAEDLLPRMRYRLRSKDGTYHWVDAEGRVAVNSEGRRISIVSTRMVDSEVAALEALQELAQHDELTGLVNRHEVFRQIERSISGPARTGTRLAMLFCDLDGFKDVNDRLGHIAGDELLRAVARRLQRAVRSGDVVARIGGDELLVVLNGVRDLDDAVSIAEKLRAEVRRPTPVSGGMVTVSASVGVAMAEAGEGIDDIVARADAAMYDAKRSGKDRVVAIRSDARPG